MSEDELAQDAETLLRREVKESHQTLKIEAQLRDISKVDSPVRIAGVRALRITLEVGDVPIQVVVGQPDGEPPYVYSVIWPTHR